MVAAEALLARLVALYDYDEDKGAFRCKGQGSGLKPAGMVAGYSEGPGLYQRMMVDGVRYRVHRLIWLRHYGEWPTRGLDHANGDKTDNRIGNLRLATQTQNNANSRVSKRNRSGLKGVSLTDCRQRWAAKIVVNDKRIYLGRFGSPEEAHAAYVAAAYKYFGEFANGG